jgi:Serine carboxypeptidase
LSFCLPGVPVTVYQGQLDLICCTLGAEAWMAKLRWPGMKGFRAAKRRPFYADNDDSGQEAEAVDAPHGAPRQHCNQAQPRDQRTQQQANLAAGAVEERRPQRTAGFIREHGPLALITVMSAGAIALAHLRVS